MKQLDNTKRAANKDEAILLRRAHSDTAPLGENIEVILNAKSWGRASNLLCYFEEITTGKLFTLSVFKNKKGYGDKADMVDFSEVGNVGNNYLLNITKSPRAKFPQLANAELYKLLNQNN